MLIDLHAKSSLSDDVSVSPRAVLERAADRGLDAVAFCETLSTTYAERVAQLGDDYDLDVFIGVEIPTDTGMLLGFAPEIDDFYRGEYWRRYTDMTTPSAESVIELFHERGGAVVSARPYDHSAQFVMGDHIFEYPGLDAVEVVNPRVDQVHNDFAVEAATYLGTPTVGGSDPRDSIDAVGTSATFFAEDVSKQSDFVEALREGQYWAVELD
jgi:predicted metal-dependent phosphoesterase TrpH